MIDAVLTIVGGFHDLRYLILFCVANQKYRKIENIFFWFATQNKILFFFCTAVI